MFDGLVFAGGGNRCYWQGGFYEAVCEHIDLAPQLVVGASAGAFAATYSLLGAGPDVRRNVIDACGPHLKNFDLWAWRRGEPLCPVGPMYQALLRQTIDAVALARINAQNQSHHRVFAVAARSVAGAWRSRRDRGLSARETPASPGASALRPCAGFPPRLRVMPRSGRSSGFSRCVDCQRRRAAIHAGDDDRRHRRVRRRPCRQRAG